MSDNAPLLDATVLITDLAASVINTNDLVLNMYDDLPPEVQHQLQIDKVAIETIAKAYRDLAEINMAISDQISSIITKFE